MNDWDGEQLQGIAGAEELDISSVRRNGRLSSR